MSRYDRLKRALDVGIGTAALVVASPVLAATAVVVRAKLGSPVIFAQQRPGRGGRPFTLIKFRTMRNPDATHITDKQRLTTTGRVLRATSLDELPTLINIVKGDMSIVGPRPLLMQYLPLYTEHQSHRHDVRPGMTGLAQVSGRNNTTWGQRLALDVWYVEHRSFALDIRIIWRTVGKVLRRDGISQQGEATMSVFAGAPDEAPVL